MKKTIFAILALLVIVIVGYFAYQATTIKSGSPISSEQTPVGSVTSSGYIDVTPAEAKNLIDTKPNLFVFDVSPNYTMGHLPRAMSYYLGGGSLDVVMPTLDRNGEYLVYCHTESASRAGAQKLVDAGFRKVYRLQGEYGAWVNAGYPIER